MNAKHFSKTMRILLVAGSLRCGYEPAPKPTERPPDVHVSEEIRAQVVDATTGAPVSGAVVLAIWRLVDSRNGRYYYIGTFKTEEVTTDEEGRFLIHRWGPRPVTEDVSLDRRDPELWVLHREYLVGYFDNTGELNPRYFAAEQTLPVHKPPPSASPETDLRRRNTEASLWNGQILKLKKAGSEAELSRSLEAANPFDREDLQRPIPKRFWEEWLAAADRLPEASRRNLRRPAGIERVSPNPTSRLPQ